MIVLKSEKHFCEIQKEAKKDHHHLYSILDKYN